MREVRESGRSPQLHEEKKEKQRAALARGAAADGTTTVPLGASETQTETCDARNYKSKGKTCGRFANPVEVCNCKRKTNKSKEQH